MRKTIKYNGVSIGEITVSPQSQVAYSTIADGPLEPFKSYMISGSLLNTSVISIYGVPPSDVVPIAEKTEKYILSEHERALSGDGELFGLLELGFVL